MTQTTDTPAADLSGMSVLVTGANRGLGAGFVTAALERGADRVYAEMVREALGPGLADVMADPQAAATALVKKFRADARAGQ